MPNPFDSIVVTRSAIKALRNAPVQVVLTTGHQELPSEIGTLPKTFITSPMCRDRPWLRAVI